MTKNKLIEIRWHGRGGQGAVTSAELVAQAAISEGKYAQAFPSFTPERRGAPVLAFNRINPDEPIRTRSEVNQPDVVLIMDPSLLSILDATSGLKKGGTVIINTKKSVEQVKREFGIKARLALVDADKIAQETLGVNIVNTTMIGAMIKATGVISTESVKEPLEKRFGRLAERNIKAMERAVKETKIGGVAGMAKAKTKEKPRAKGELGWKEIEIGCFITEPGNSVEIRTGDWKSRRPVVDLKKCNKCTLCYFFCPEGCIAKNSDGYFEADLFYCKGCGICATECPKDAITMVEEAK